MCSSDLIAGSAAPAIAKEGVLVFAGADDGSHYGNPPQLHPGQRAEWYAMDPRAKRVTKVGHLAQGVVTTPLVEWSGVAIVVSGETKPGVRTALVQSVRMSWAASPLVSDGLMALLVCLALVICWRRSRGQGATSAAAHAARAEPDRWSWLAVGLLFVVAMLNYLDRQLLATTAEPILRDIPQSKAEFG